jgi:hypothetical protein
MSRVAVIRDIAVKNIATVNEPSVTSFMKLTPDKLVLQEFKLTPSPLAESSGFWKKFKTLHFLCNNFCEVGFFSSNRVMTDKKVQLNTDVLKPLHRYLCMKSGVIKMVNEIKSIIKKGGKEVFNKSVC